MIRSIRELNERGREFWDRRTATESKLLDNPETAHYVLENLQAEAHRHAYDMRVRRDLGAAASQLNVASAELQRVSTDLNKIHRGSDKRKDQRDRATFVTWIRDNDLRVDSIAVLTERPDFRWAYDTRTLRRWYRQAMPQVQLRRGRPKLSVTGKK